MQGDLRETALYRETQAVYEALRRPGTGQISDALEVHAAPDARSAAFAAISLDKVEGAAPSRICEVELASGQLRVLTFGPHTDRLPKYSPDGRSIAFLSDRHRPGDFQPYLLERASGAARALPRVDGWVEYLQWSPDGTRILLGVAGHGADISGGQGAISSSRAAADVPSWIPAVEGGDESYRWRRAWVYELGSDTMRQVSAAQTNVWEASWCGDAALAAVVSPGPGEGLWYRARLQIIELASGNGRDVYAPRDQIGWPAASPSGKHLAIVEAVCSDRWIVAGDLRVIDTIAGEVRRVDTRGVDIACTEWRSETRLLLAGHRGLETVVGVFDVATGVFTELWASEEITTGERYVRVAGLGDRGDCVLIGEGFQRAPEIAAVRSGSYRVVRSFDLGCAEQVSALRSVQAVSWKAADGLQIQGWLLLPQGKGPHPLVMNVHGGPVWHWRPMWFGRGRGLPVLVLLRHGYAVFMPNPRGSSGRGQEFARYVLGDMGVADAGDYLSGIDMLVAAGHVDRKRLGVTGGSYGGFMTSWLITQDTRFAAAVAVAPMTNHVSQHLVSNIPHFVSLFLADHYSNPAGKYFTRSPIMHADRVATPTLNICGALDRCTPPEEAVQFHNALLERGVKSVLVTYPEEGHGVRRFPAVIDYVARLVGWFEDHMPPGRA